MSKYRVDVGFSGSEKKIKLLVIFQTKVKKSESYKTMEIHSFSSDLWNIHSFETVETSTV